MTIVDCAVYENGHRKDGKLDLQEAYEHCQRDSASWVWIGLHHPTEDEFRSVREESVLPLAGSLDGRRFSTTSVVLTTGTFLRGLIHRGEETIPAGRAGELPPARAGELPPVPGVSPDMARREPDQREPVRRTPPVGRQAPHLQR